MSAYPLIDLQITGLADPESDVAELQQELEKAEQIRVEVENRKRELEWQKKQELELMKLEDLAGIEPGRDRRDGHRGHGRQIHPGNTATGPGEQ